MFEDCLIPIIVASILFVISITFVVMTIKLNSKVNKTDLLRLYEIKNGETLTSTTSIRKNDGTGCTILRTYDENGDNTTKSGDACKE